VIHLCQQNDLVFLSSKTFLVDYDHAHLTLKLWTRRGQFNVIFRLFDEEEWVKN